MLKSLPAAIILLAIAAVPTAAQRGRPDFFERGYDQLQDEIRDFQQTAPAEEPGDAPSEPPLTLDSGSHTWRPVLLREYGAGVLMPNAGAIARDRQTVETLTGPVGFEVVASNLSDSRYVLAASDPLNPEMTADPRALLDRVRDRLATERAGFALDGERDGTFAGLPSKIFVLASDTETITYRLLAAEERLYVLAVGQTSAIADIEAVGTFFESFQLLDE